MGIGLTDSVTALGKAGKAAADWHVKKNQLKRHAIAYTELEIEKDLDGDGVVGAVGCSARHRNRLLDDDPRRPTDPLRTKGRETRALSPADRSRPSRDSRRSPPRKTKSTKSRKSRKSQRKRK